MNCEGVGVELHVPDFAPVEAFYGALGFTVVWRDDEYLLMRMNDTLLRFWPGNDSVNHRTHSGGLPEGGQRGLGVEIVIQVEDLDVLYSRAQALDAVVVEMVKRPWGLRDFRISDPYGYYLRFTEPHDVSNMGPI